jgi:tetratricopeptide (TPR) repeat protein
MSQQATSQQATSQQATIAERAAKENYFFQHHSSAYTSFTGWGMALLLTAAITWLSRRSRNASAASGPVTSSKNQPTQEALETLRFTQALQWVSYGKQLERAGQHEAALTIYEKGLSQHPQDFRLWHERGLVLAKLQRFEEALTSYDNAYQIRPHQRDLAHERGDTLLQLKQYEDAIASFDIFLAYAPNNTHILADRGYALFQLQRYEEALQSLNRALGSRQNDQQSMLYARYYQIETLRQLGQLEAALRSSQQALKQTTGEKFQQQYAALQEQISNARKLNR